MRPRPMRCRRWPNESRSCARSIVRLRADIACFQEVNGQERPGQPRALLALTELLTETNLAPAQLVSTEPVGGVYDERNQVVATALPVLAREQLRNDLVEELSYRRLTAIPPDDAAVSIGIERPVLHVQITLPDGGPLHDVAGRGGPPTGRPDPGRGTGRPDRRGRRLQRRTRRGAGHVYPRRCGEHRQPRLNLTGRVLVPIEHTIPAPARYTLFHQGRGEMLDHMLITRNLLAHYRGSEIHNELLHDESAEFAIDRKYPESDHAPAVATFDFPT
jgi:hypothetical protein